MLVVPPELEFPDVELPLVLPELDPELPPELPELELPAPAVPPPRLPVELEPDELWPVFPATFVEVLTWVEEALKFAVAAVFTVTLGDDVLTTVELLRPFESVFA